MEVILSLKRGNYQHLPWPPIYYSLTNISVLSPDSDIPKFGGGIKLLFLSFFVNSKYIKAQEL